MKILAIGGIPGTGKSTLIKKFLDQVNDFEKYSPIKLVDGLYSKSKNLFVVGKYSPFYFDEEIFEGTDKLAMNVQPNFIKFLKETDMNILFEGDRLFTNSLFSEIVEMDNVEKFEILILETDKGILSKRYENRGSEQSEKFISSRKTKIENISCNFDLMNRIIYSKNEDGEDMNKNLEFIHNFF